LPDVQGLISATLLPHLPGDLRHHNFMVTMVKADTSLYTPGQLILCWD